VNLHISGKPRNFVPAKTSTFTVCSFDVNMKSILYITITYIIAYLLCTSVIQNVIITVLVNVYISSPYTSSEISNTNNPVCCILQQRMQPLIIDESISWLSNFSRIVLLLYLSILVSKESKHNYKNVFL